jgi:hypothetical protein
MISELPSIALQEITDPDNSIQKKDSLNTYLSAECLKGEGEGGAWYGGSEK